MNKKILIVDDALFMRKMIRNILEKIDSIDIKEAENGEEALKIYEQEKADLILLDITMPGMSGLEVLEKIRSENEDACVIMCSAVGQESMLQKSVLLGARDFIVKPFKKDEFLKIVQHYL